MADRATPTHAISCRKESDSFHQKMPGRLLERLAQGTVVFLSTRGRVRSAGVSPSWPMRGMIWFAVMRKAVRYTNPMSRSSTNRVSQ